MANSESTRCASDGKACRSELAAHKVPYSAPSAKLFGFRQAIAHGLWTKARALAAMLPRQPIGQAEVMVEFKTPLYLPGRASLWSTRQVKGKQPHNAIFEVRNAKGDKPHLRAQLAYTVAA